MEWAAALIWQSLDDGGVLGDTVTREHRCGRAAAEAFGESTRGIDLLTGDLSEAHPGAAREGRVGQRIADNSDRDRNQLPARQCRRRSDGDRVRRGIRRVTVAATSNAPIPMAVASLNLIAPSLGTCGYRPTLPPLGGLSSYEGDLAKESILTRCGSRSLFLADNDSLT